MEYEEEYYEALRSALANTQVRYSAIIEQLMLQTLLCCDPITGPSLENPLYLHWQYIPEPSCRSVLRFQVRSRGTCPFKRYQGWIER